MLLEVHVLLIPNTLQDTAGNMVHSCPYRTYTRFVIDTVHHRTCNMCEGCVRFEISDVAMRLRVNP